MVRATQSCVDLVLEGTALLLRSPKSESMPKFDEFSAVVWFLRVLHQLATSKALHR